MNYIFIGGAFVEKEDWKKIMDNQDHKYLIKTTLPDHDKLIEYLRFHFPTTGMADKMFCNSFMSESVELLKHAVFLYEDGYFDCAFYSVRQSIENLNNMLYLSEDDENLNNVLCLFNDNEKLKKWKAKERFPSDKKIKDILQETNNAYLEIKSAIPEVFDTYDKLLKKANKYVHKQGFDTFFIYPWKKEELIAQRTSLFVELLKQAIGMLLLMNIVLDPLAFALCDSEVEKHIYFDPMTEPIPLRVFEELYDFDVSKRIKQTTFYKDFIQYFLDQEELNRATYNVVRCQYFDVSALEDIERQIHILNIYEKLCFKILKLGAKISHFYFENDILGYATSISPVHRISEYRFNQFNTYLVDGSNTNLEWKNMYISTSKVFDTWIILQHNDKLDDNNLKEIQKIISCENEEYEKINFSKFT